MDTEQPPYSFDGNPNDSFGYLLHEVTKAWRLTLDEMMHSIDLSCVALMAISILAFSPKPLTQRELAKKMNIKGPTIVRLLDRLEVQGWVRREQVPSDRRMKYVILTAKCFPHYHRAVHTLGKLEKELLDNIEPAKVQTATEVLLILKSILHNQDGLDIVKHNP